MKRSFISFLILLLILFSPAVFGQNAPSSQPTPPAKPDDTTQDMLDMPGMQHGSAHNQATTFIDEILHHSTSGTSAQPNSSDEPMIMRVRGKWMFMFHGVAFLSALQQSGPRGYDKVFSTNWFMPMAQRRIGRGELTLRTMLSLEPATVTQRFYPLLFQQGETAFGKPINDGQHPHDFIMELAALYDLRLGKMRCYRSMLRRSVIQRWAQALTRIVPPLPRIP